LSEVKVQLGGNRSRVIRERKNKRKLLGELKLKLTASSIKELYGMPERLGVLVKLLGKNYKSEQNFAKQRKKLSWPVDGELVPGEKAVKKTGLRGKGILISSLSGKEVKSVFWGRVVFADWFKGYGKLAIIDHGREFYSLYAHLGKIEVKVKDKVKKGEVIAFINSASPKKTDSLYFELRKKGAEINPLDWLKKKNYHSKP